MHNDDEKKKTRVLIVAPRLPIVGGQTVQAGRLFSRLNHERHVYVGLQAINPRFFPTLQRVKFLRTFLTWSKYVFDLLSNIRKYDVIHIFSASYTSFLLSPSPALLVSKLHRKPTILNYRSGEAEDHLNRWRTAVPTIRHFDKIVVPSDYLVDIFAKFGLEAEVIFNFVDTKSFPFRERNPLRPIFLSNRNFESHYNVGCTLRAFKVIQLSIPDAKLTVVGDGPEREFLKDLSRNLKLKDVEFRGPVQPDDMPAAYDEADIYLNSSSIDNMPNSIIEAFSAGLPVVTTNAGGIPYIVDDGRTGLMVGTDDHVSLAESALRLLRDQEMAQNIIVQARREVEKYSWERVRDQWVELYRGLANK